MCKIWRERENHNITITVAAEHYPNWGTQRGRGQLRSDIERLMQTSEVATELEVGAGVGAGMLLSGKPIGWDRPFQTSQLILMLRRTLGGKPRWGTAEPSKVHMDEVCAVSILCCRTTLPPLHGLHSIEQRSAGGAGELVSTPKSFINIWKVALIILPFTLFPCLQNRVRRDNNFTFVQCFI